MNVTVSTTLPQEVLIEIKQNRWLLNELIYAGIEYKKNVPSLNRRQTEMTLEIEKLQTKMLKLQKYILEVQNDETKN